MPRGRSMRPHGARSPPSVPAELQNSLFAVPAFAIAAPSSPNHSMSGDKTAAAAAAAAAVAHAVHEAALEQVRVFDDAGNLTTRQTGISTFHFRPLTLFYRLRAQSWVWLLSFSVCAYLAIVLSISVLYYAWSAVCGAAGGTRMIVSVYFTVVSLAANGGYMGEDMRAMTNAAHVCYTGRTYIVMLCSYVNILFVGLVVALVVSKATYTGTLSNRIVFSDYCSLTPVPYRESAAALAVGGGGSDNKPNASYRRGSRIDTDAQRQQHTTKKTTTTATATATAAGKKCADCGGGGGVSCGPQWRLCFRMANMENKQPLAHGNLRLFCVTAEPLKEYRQERRAQRYKRRVAQRRQQQQQNADDADEEHKDDDEHDASPTTTTTAASTTTAAQEQRRRDASPDDTSHGSAQTNSSVSSQRDAQFSHDATSPTAFGQQQQQQHRNSAATAVSSSSMYNPPPTAATASSYYGTLATHADAASATTTAARRAGAAPDTTPLLQRDATAVLTRSPSSSSLHHMDEREHAYLHAMPEEAMARVRVNVREMRWSCPEETYLDHGLSGQLSLWYPATITHLVDEHSPLFRFVEAVMQDGEDSATYNSGGGGSSSTARTTTAMTMRARHAGVLSRKFQIVAVFSATEMETGATIMAKHTYIASDIVTDAKFSSKLVHMQPYRGDVLLDYHYFNELLPMTVVESSTTDSDSA